MRLLPPCYVAITALLAGCAGGDHPSKQAVQPELGSRQAPVIQADGFSFRDLDRDGKLTPYEDWRLPVEQRVADLVDRMTLEEKAATMMHPVLGKTHEQITDQMINSVLSRDSKPPVELAENHNALQEAAESTRLGIPVTISTDPRNQFSSMAGMSVNASGFSQWPGPLGFGAIGDPDLVQHYASIVAEEYRAAGINMALSPQADLATEPRWLRINGTFGEDPELVGKLVNAYTVGAQGSPSGLKPEGVAVVVKHFAGYGAAKDGWDAHAHYGRFSTHASGRLDDHIAPFRPAFRSNVAGVMSTYSVLEADGHPQVAGAYNKVLLTDILRDQEKYKGMVLTDWNVTEDCLGPCLGQPHTGSREGMLGKPWGVEELSRPERMVMAIISGVDQFGGEADSAPIVDAVKAGKLDESRINTSVSHIMTIKFNLGLFENPFVDTTRMGETFNRPATREASLAAQKRSLVLLKNQGGLLPVNAKGRRVFLQAVNRDAAEALGFVVVDKLEDAELAIIRVGTPFKTGHTNYPFGRFQPEGDLDFKPDHPNLKSVQTAAQSVPVVLVANLARAAVLTNVESASTATIAEFGVSDKALLEVIAGIGAPGGRLPLELPSSMEAVEAQKSDLPHDSQQPLHPIGYGLSY